MDWVGSSVSLILASSGGFVGWVGSSVSLGIFVQFACKLAGALFTRGSAWDLLSTCTWGSVRDLLMWLAVMLLEKDVGPRESIATTIVELFNELAKDLWSVESFTLRPTWDLVGFNELCTGSWYTAGS